MVGKTTGMSKALWGVGVRWVGIAQTVIMLADDFAC